MVALARTVLTMMPRYPENTTVDIEDFRRSGWKTAIAFSDRGGYSSMWRPLHLAAKAAVESGNLAEGKLLWLFADACSLRLDPESPNAPLRPTFPGAVAVDCFEASDIELFAQIAEDVDDAWLQGRLADLVWLLNRPRELRYALLAIDAYRKLDLAKERCSGDGKQCWQRAINLARSLGPCAEERVTQMEGSILAAFDAAGKEDGFLAFWLSELLFENRMGRSHSASVAERLQSLAQLFDEVGESVHARRYFHSAAKWYKAAGNRRNADEMTLSIAEACVKAAEQKKSSEPPNYAAAHDLYESAVQILRKIRGSREELRIAERLLEIRRLMRDAGERAVEGMKLYKAPSIDPWKMIQDARKAVTGKTAEDALVALAAIVPIFRKAELVERAKESLELPSRALFPTTHMASDGRVIAKQVDPHTDEEEALLGAMVKEYTADVVIFVQGSILPALEVINLEHRLHEADLVWLAEQSPIVPRGRARFFGKALFAGFDQDFVGALHLLIPQFEAMVRFHLQGVGAVTTHLGTEGIENEKGLSALVKFPEMVRVFGEDLSFEITALFCHQLGPNLRNQLAHGLLSYGACESFASVYAWWFGLRIILANFYKSRRTNPQGDETEAEAAECERGSDAKAHEGE